MTSYVSFLAITLLAWQVAGELPEKYKHIAHTLKRSDALKIMGTAQCSQSKSIPVLTQAAPDSEDACLPFPGSAA